MTVKELIRTLDNIIDKDINIIVSKDEEGNEFNTLRDTCICFAKTKDTHRYDLVEDINEHEDRELVLVLWP